jgi:NAD(P)-dependent dehydrogenase (short-subunit alcohol dehydrogenase family)
MSDNKVWFITGAGRGMGVDIAKAVGMAENLLVVKLDITSPTGAEAAVGAAFHVRNEEGVYDEVSHSRKNRNSGLRLMLRYDVFRRQRR